MSASKRLKTHKAKKADGGKVNEYNAQGSPEVAEAKSKGDGFKKGGKADGEKSKTRLDKRKRGGKMSAGGSPYTAAANRSPYKNGGDGAGHMGIGSERDSTAQ